MLVQTDIRCIYFWNWYSKPVSASHDVLLGIFSIRTRSFSPGGVTAGEDVLKRLKVRISYDEYIRRKINFHQLKLTLNEFLFSRWLHLGDFRTVWYVRVVRVIRPACVPAALTERKLEIPLIIVYLCSRLFLSYLFFRAAVTQTRFGVTSQKRSDVVDSFSLEVAVESFCRVLF